jgi:protein O-mannosyl-transferase
VETASKPDPAQWGAPMMVASLTCAAFLPVLRNGFVDWDDDNTLLQNPYYRGLGWDQLRWMFTTFHMGHYQPLSWVTFGLDYLVWGTDPFGYHLTSLILHTANAVLFYFICRRLLAIVFSMTVERQRLDLSLAAALAALLFAVHPLRVESVAWATERRDVLSGFFFLACIEFYLRAQEYRDNQTRRRWITAAALIAHALSLFSKATAITVPIVLLLLDIYPLKRLPLRFSTWFKPAARSVLREKLPFFCLAVLFGLIALAAQQHAGALQRVQQYSFSYRVAQAFYGIGFYLWKSVLPVRLSPLYELPSQFDTWMPLFFVSAVAVVFVTIAFYLLRQRWPALLACWVYYIVVVSPMLGIAQSGPQLAADRYSYLSCLSWAALAGGVCLTIWRQAQRRDKGALGTVRAAVLAVSVVAGLVVLTWNQVGVWRDTKTLWQHALQIAPETSIAHYNLARFLAKRGNQAEAIGHYREAIKFKPGDPDAHNNLGLLLALRGDFEASLAEFGKATEINPRYAKAFFNMGRVLANQGDLMNASAKYQEALKLDPQQAEIHFGFATVLARQGDLAAATKHFREATKLKPGFAEAHESLGRALLLQGDREAAVKHIEEAVRIMKSRPTSQALP